MAMARQQPYSMSGNGTGYSDAAAVDAILLTSQQQEGPYGNVKLFSKTKRPESIIPNAALCLVVPWLIFVIMVFVQSLGLHYQSRGATKAICILMFIGVLFLGVIAFQVMLRKFWTGKAEQKSLWYVFLFLSSFLAWSSGLAAGQYNYFSNMLPYYDANNLNTYKAVDPANVSGQQYMDGGRFFFVDNARLDIGRSIGFRNRDMYCVAPIVSGNGSLTSVDFWAVGINCCSGHDADFHCGEYNSPQARAGLRIMNDAQRPFFRLAVQQATAAYNMRADHPIFLSWMANPSTEMNAYEDDGFKFLMTSVFGYLAIQLLMTTLAVVFVAKFSSRGSAQL